MIAFPPPDPPEQPEPAQSQLPPIPALASMDAERQLLGQLLGPYRKSGAPLTDFLQPSDFTEFECLVALAILKKRLQLHVDPDQYAVAMAYAESGKSMPTLCGSAAATENLAPIALAVMTASLRRSIERATKAFHDDIAAGVDPTQRINLLISELAGRSTWWNRGLQIVADLDHEIKTQQSK